MDSWTPVLAPGVRVLRRSESEVQVGVEPGRAVVLPLTDRVRESLSALEHGRDSTRADAGLLAELRVRGLVVAREGPPPPTAVELHTAGGVDAELLGQLLAAGLEPADDAAGRLGLLVWNGEPDRGRLDDWVRRQLAHLVVRFVAGGVVIGPFVVPGQSACLRCIDTHRATDDSRWPVLLAQQTTSAAEAAAAESPDPLVSRLALAWAVADLRSQGLGRVPATHSTTVWIRPDLADTQVTAWRPYPGCGCL